MAFLKEKNQKNHRFSSTVACVAHCLWHALRVLRVARMQVVCNILLTTTAVTIRAWQKLEYRYYVRPTGGLSTEPNRSSENTATPHILWTWMAGKFIRKTRKVQLTEVKPVNSFKVSYCHLMLTCSVLYQREEPRMTGSPTLRKAETLFCFEQQIVWKRNRCFVSVLGLTDVQVINTSMWKAIVYDEFGQLMYDEQWSLGWTLLVE